MFFIHKFQEHVFRAAEAGFSITIVSQIIIYILFFTAKKLFHADSWVIKRKGSEWQIISAKLKGQCHQIKGKLVQSATVTIKIMYKYTQYCTLWLQHFPDKSSFVTS